MAPTVQMEFEIKGDNLDRQLVQTEKGFDKIAAAAKRAGRASRDGSADAKQGAAELDATLGKVGGTLALLGAAGAQAYRKLVEEQNRAIASAEKLKRSIAESLAGTGDLANAPQISAALLGAPGRLDAAGRVEMFNAARGAIPGASIDQALGVTTSAIGTVGNLFKDDAGKRNEVASLAARFAQFAGVGGDEAVSLALKAVQGSGTAGANSIVKGLEQFGGLNVDKRAALDSVIAAQIAIQQSGQSPELLTQAIKGLDAYAGATRQAVNPSTGKAETLFANAAFRQEYLADPLGSFNRLMTGQLGDEATRAIMGEQLPALRTIIKQGRFHRGLAGISNTGPSYAADEARRQEGFLGPVVEAERAQAAIQADAIRRGEDAAGYFAPGNARTADTAESGGGYLAIQISRLLGTLEGLISQQGAMLQRYDPPRGNGIDVRAQDGLDARSY